MGFLLLGGLFLGAVFAQDASQLPDPFAGVAAQFPNADPNPPFMALLAPPPPMIVQQSIQIHIGGKNSGKDDDGGKDNDNDNHTHNNGLPSSARRKLPMVLFKQNYPDKDLRWRNSYRTTDELGVRRGDMDKVIQVDTNLCVSKSANPRNGCSLKSLTVDSKGLRFYDGKTMVGYIATNPGQCGANRRVWEFKNLDRGDYVYACEGKGCYELNKEYHFKKTGNSVWMWSC
ncbi:unnamed protein product, partial [Mesorhabditis spiculigera]